MAGVRTAGIAEARRRARARAERDRRSVLADDGRLVAVLGLQGPERFDAAARRAARAAARARRVLLAATAG